MTKVVNAIKHYKTSPGPVFFFQKMVNSYHVLTQCYPNRLVRCFFLQKLDTNIDLNINSFLRLH